uniref:Uncharacterized protein n=1 Tax=Oryza meridionalis TaxID=40149 RepID=A0A0E0ENS3_9ORYZ
MAAEGMRGEGVEESLPGQAGADADLLPLLRRLTASFPMQTAGRGSWPLPLSCLGVGGGTRRRRRRRRRRSGGDEVCVCFCSVILCRGFSAKMSR